MSAKSTQHGSTGLLLFLALSLVVALMNSSAPTPLYPLYKEHLQLSSVDLTYIFGAYGIGVLAALIVLAGVAGRIKEQRFLLVPAIALVMFGAWLCALCDSLLALCVARMIAGLGAGIMTTSVNVSLVRFGPRDNGKLAATLATLAMITGLALGPILSGVALQLDLNPASLPFWLIMAAIAGTGAGALALWPRNGSLPSLDHPHASSSLREGLRGIGRPFHLCAWSVFFSWSLAACIFVMGPGAAEQQLGLGDRGLFGYCMAVYLLIAGASQLLCRRLEAPRALRSGLIAQCAALLLLLAAFNAHSLILAGFGLGVAGYAYGAIFVGSARLINQLAPAHCHAKLVAYFYTTIYLFNAVPIPLGLLVDSMGLACGVLIALTVFLVIGAVLVLLAAKARLPHAHPLPG
ncbi:MFS transporter [Pseudomonas azotoformans]|uniref:MFS transporter n=1 Tax=Pseudomonas azotoformans TaxID=47878 RepID=A0A1V2JHP3_PSEAZ|nr:MFS transporter [Pseudomonas azotoformans]OIN46416.1 MFS transporter [Pseudomonas azotoformans]ONH44872.1 MFS transporter [Pseudomonas azotoformans]SDN11415.1 Predicted arabinose efflux permease, MFS family [Pseudomonas azotoformans]